MFEGFQRQWTPATLISKLGKLPARVVVAGEPLVFFRDGTGTLHALIDRCPHRGVALSNGRVNEQGHLQCPFHGWSWGADGVCKHVPLNDLPPETLATMRAGRVPCVERAAMAWVFTSTEDIEPEPFPELPPAVEDPALAFSRVQEEWDTHWTRAMENMLDSPHLPFVHRSTIGRGLVRSVARGETMELFVEPAEFGFTFWSEVGGQRMEGAFLEWRRPNGMVLHIPVPGRLFRQHVWCVPVGPKRVRMILISSRNFGLYNPLFKVMDLFNMRVLHEDRDVLASSDPPEVPHPSQELSVRTDKPTLRFRAWYLKHLKGDPAFVAEDDSSVA